ncbi:hypothetical protein H4Q32_025804 [Labeo rohita]|uniref:Anaphylatoxin-like domain-containing protein n=1 Tax=Labeo rohita TaxID=84645 RepID=A0ABQ8MV54_LABRO|nr:hypothetical protein H4Q32_025804 [Labeo rohita]
MQLCYFCPHCFYTNFIFSAGQYSGELKKCCVDGLQDNKLGYSCERQASFIVYGEECVEAFLHCCRKMKHHTEDFAEKELLLARSEEDDFEKESEDVMVRTQFPESWLWKEIDLPACPPNSLCVETSTLTTETLKDSITTWQITAISLSKTFAVPLIIIPMELNEQWIEVEAHSFDSKDKIMKKLKVVPEGVLTEARERTEQINPSKHPGGLQVVSVRSNIPPRKGGVHKDADASLTAFVLIAMQEGSKICNEPNLQSSMKRAVDYLLLKVHSLTSAYDVAMTSYALALAGKLNKDILKRHSTESKGQLHYSLSKSECLVEWKATSIVFQAVAEYRTQVKQPDISLNLDLAVEGRKDKTTITIQPTNIHISRSDKFDITKSFNITAQGTGVAMLSVFSVYYALPEEKDYDCNVFDLSVQMVKEPAVSYDGASESYQITIEYIFKDPSKNSGMSILDIGLLTGFKVDERDLSKLLSGKDKYIQNFELNKELSERGSLIIYIDKISNKEKDRLVFSMHKMNEVGILQPARITVYEYYAPVYKTRVLEMGFSLHADIYNMTIEKVVKEGMGCYFLSDSLWQLRYHLGEDTWIEYWPTDKESQTVEHRKRYIGITSLADELLRFGCST